MNPIKRELKWWANALFFRNYRYRRIERRHLLGAYSPTAPMPAETTDSQTLVMMNDGRCPHGGFADRLRAIISFYRLCRQRGLRFKINFTYPFSLESYYIPADYDWTIRGGDISYNSLYAHPFFMDTIGIHGPREIKWEEKYITEKVLKAPYKQLHVYSPFDTVTDDAEFARLFKELFKPSHMLEKALAPHRHQLGDKYISVSTRFMELLGDFEEPHGSRRLTPEQKQSLIASCIARIVELHTAHPDAKVLVTSDSGLFLDACRHLPWVYIVDGVIAHSDMPGTSDHLKTILDFQLISEANEVFQLRSGGMYAGNFSLKAAKAGGKPHRLIEF